MINKLFFIVSLLLAYSVAAQHSQYVVVQNEAYISIMDCNNRLPVAVVYSLTRDIGNAKRYPRYIDDVKLKRNYPECHPITEHRFRTYQSVLTAKGIKQQYDVGHLAMSNHLDDNDSTIKTANQFSNLAPQAAAFNRSSGAWYYQEIIAECNRDIEDLIILVGTIDDPATTDKDYFVDTFGQTTPDFWWRIIYWQSSNKYKAWIMPNEDSSTEKMLLTGKYDIKLSELKKIIPIPLELIGQIESIGAEEANSDFYYTKAKGGTLNCRGTTTGLG